MLAATWTLVAHVISGAFMGYVVGLVVNSESRRRGNEEVLSATSVLKCSTRLGTFVGLLMGTNELVTGFAYAWLGVGGYVLGVAFDYFWTCRGWPRRKFRRWMLPSWAWTLALIGYIVGLLIDIY